MIGIINKPVFIRRDEKGVKELFHSRFRYLTEYLNIEPQQADKLINYLFNGTNKNPSAFFQNNLGKFDTPVRLAFQRRATTINRQLCLLWEKIGIDSPVDIYDLGCGNGSVALELISSQSINFNNLRIGDTSSYLYKSVSSSTQLSFEHLPQNYTRLTTINNEKLDCILLITVLHHCEKPDKVIQACYDSLKPGGVVLVSESCIGIEDWHFKNLTSIEGHKLALTEDHQLYLDLKDKQLLYSSVCDWIYHEMISGCNLELTVNYRSPEDWNSAFQQVGFYLSNYYLQGFDLKLSPEFHTYHVFHKPI